MSYKQNSSNNNNKIDYTFKILFLGSMGVGKTSIIYRYINDTIKNELKSTIGIDYKTKVVEYKTKKIKLKIYDTSGQERFRTLTQNYYHGSDGIIIVFDLKRRETFDDITYWMEEINKNTDKDKIGLILVGNKNDGDEKERKISKEEGVNISNIYNFKYIETSALTNENIKECFYLIIQSIFEQLKIDNVAINNKQGNNSKTILNQNNCFNNENNSGKNCCYG